MFPLKLRMEMSLLVLIAVIVNESSICGGVFNQISINIP